MPTPIVVPKLNENDDEVVVVELADGYVQPGQPLFSVETSKAVQEVEAEAAGFVLWTVQVGDRLGVLAEVGWLFATEDERDAWSPERKPAAAEALAAGERLATEPARRLAAQLGVAIEDVPAAGIVRESDVRVFAAAAPAEPEPRLEEPSAGRLSDELRERLRTDGESIAALSSDEKVALYRQHGAAIGEGVTIGRGTLLDAQFVEIGADTSIGEEVLVRARRFTIGELGQIGASCRFFCRDFVAGDVVTLRWNVAVVDGQGGIHDCRIGDLCFVAYDTYLNTDRDVTLGERVCLSPGARIYTHRKWLEALDGYPFSYAPVSIGERSWLGPGSLLLPGVVLDAEVTVMANSVVASNAPARCPPRRCTRHGRATDPAFRPRPGAPRGGGPGDLRGKHGGPRGPRLDARARAGVRSRVGREAVRAGGGGCGGPRGRENRRRRRHRLRPRGA